MKAEIYSLDGKHVHDVQLPAQFQYPYRDDLIKRAVLSEESRTFQPKGSYPLAGLETSARYKGRKEDFGTVKNKGIPHLPHEVLPKGQLGKVKRVPHSVKGRRAHPPKATEKLVEEMNKKEYTHAFCSALSATANKSVVSARCVANSLAVSSISSLPFILENSFENLKKTKDVEKVFVALKISALVEKSKEKSSAVSGVRHRTVRTKVPRSVLVVVGKKCDAIKAARNLSGVDAVDAEGLKVLHLAPGTHAGRITVFTESALSALEKRLSS